MIDRGALILAPKGSYRGLYRPTLDGLGLTGKARRRLVERYTAAVVAGDGVLEDLDEALALCAEARRMGVEGVEVIVLEVPQEPFAPGRLDVVAVPPAAELTLLGWDVVEGLEPYHSPLAADPPPAGVNEHGLLPSRRDAEALAARLNDANPDDEPFVATRVWAAVTAPPADASQGT